MKPRQRSPSKDYVTIGISLIALLTTIIFNVLLKTDAISGVTRGDVSVLVKDDDLLVVDSMVSLVVSNSGNRTATLYSAGVGLRIQNDDWAGGADVCERRNWSFVYSPDFKPQVIKPGEAYVINLEFKGQSISAANPVKESSYVVSCLFFKVFTPDSVVDGSQKPLAVQKAVRSDKVPNEWSGLSGGDKPFVIYQKRALSL